MRGARGLEGVPSQVIGQRVWARCGLDRTKVIEVDPTVDQALRVLTRHPHFRGR
jgi:hypothetical protein